ncbi:ribosome modulation factor [Bermanella sp. WJH001]|jgi:ribosome modulation factor|uniref:ribosome modulation factor n=1 Tax=Bermanella sp. WJH001 TaxID=3048005 RepID=UPI0024BE7D30|nr:ribosome modulation factor [Bermanella sp. WJH001]MDJ1536678.1 ribosome modulation factor [Bermanella sp. WJH001]
MRRQKRDMDRRAFQKGYMAGVQGRSKDLCPEGTAHFNWMSGWREGRADHWDGYSGVAGVHRLPV